MSASDKTLAPLYGDDAASDASVPTLSNDDVP